MIKILEENNFFIALSKPPGMSVHNEIPSVKQTLEAIKKPIHFVNRLDQETSGLMIVAQKAELHAPLSEALNQGQKFYRALLRGPWTKGEKSASWSWPISDKSEGHRSPQGLTKDRVDARTLVEVVRFNSYFTEVYLELLTGRQHQIRKHATLAKHAIVGDKRYGDKKYNENIAKRYAINRMHLHAEKLVFNFQGKDYSFHESYSLDSFFTQN